MNTGRNASAEPVRGIPERIEPRLRDALDHPVRRDILRALAAAPGPQSLAAISRPVLSGSCSLPALGYHAQVLERATLTESGCSSASSAPRFTLSKRATRLDVLRTLQATKAEDRIAGFRALASGSLASSSGIPRFWTAMELGAKHRRSEGS